MNSLRFWLLFCLCILLAIYAFGGPVFARARKAPVEPKHLSVQPKPRPVIVKLGKPYKAELRPLAKNEHHL